MRLPESGSRLRLDPTFNQSYATLHILSESPSSRPTASVGLTAATNKLEFTYSIQRISRRVLTYTQYMVIMLESQLKGSNAPSAQDVVYKERTRSDHWFLLRFTTDGWVAKRISDPQ